MLYLRGKITNRARARAESNVFRAGPLRSINQSINQSNCLMENASSMILSQEACWNDTTYRKHMQTNLEIYDEIHVPNY